MRAISIILAGLLSAASGPTAADWTPVQLGPGGPIIEQDWGLYRPGHGSPRILNGPILMPVPRPIGMPEPVRQHYERFYYQRGWRVPGSGDGIVRKDTPPTTAGGGALSGSLSWYSEPGWRHWYPGGLEPEDRPKPKPAAAPQPAKPYYRSWHTPTMPDAVQPVPSYEGPPVAIDVEPRRREPR